MGENLVTLRKTGGFPEIEIVIGQAQYGKYRLTLWDPEGSEPEKIGEGVNVDNIPDLWEIKRGRTVKDLDKAIVTSEVIVAAPDSRPGQSFSVTTYIRQGGNVVESSTESGALDGVKHVFARRRLMVI